MLKTWICVLSIELVWYLMLSCHAVMQGQTDYCLLESFTPMCKQDELVLINKALYGRMEVGKCVKPGAERIGCYTNVMRILDNLCSGKRSCSVKVVHDDLMATNPCSSLALSSYLSVLYSCIKAENSEKTCNGQDPVTISSPKGFISGQKCPVALQPTSGTRINITLYNFLKPKDRSACYEVGTLKDGNTQKPLHACENSERRKSVHISTSPSVEIKFLDSLQKEQHGSFLLYYEAIGCPKPPTPENAYALREGDTATIVCNNSDTTWTTTCKDNTWTELDRECPEDWSFTGIIKSSKEFPYGIFLTSIIGVSLGVLIGGFFLFLAINAFQRYQRRGQHYGPPPVIPDPDYKIYDTANMNLPFVPGLGHSTLPRHQMAAADAPQAPPPMSEATMKRLSRHTYERPNYPSV